jgi:hypothetical protein
MGILFGWRMQHFKTTVCLCLLCLFIFSPTSDITTLFLSILILNYNFHLPWPFLAGPLSRKVKYVAIN